MRETTNTDVSTSRGRRAGGIAPLILVVAGLIGIAVSWFSTRDHLNFKTTGGTEAGVCTALLDSGCEAAHSSDASEIFGIPISHFGTAFYLSVIALALFAWFRRRRPDSAPFTSTVAALVAVMGLMSVGYSVFLASLLLRANEVCPLCFALYGVNATLLVTGVVWWLRGQRRLQLRALVVSGVVAGIAGGGFFAVSTPLLLRSLATPKVWAAARIHNPAGLQIPAASLPERVPAKGRLSASDVVIEFSDLECPHCATMHRTLAEVAESRGPDGLRVRFVNYPLDADCNPHVLQSVYPNSCMLARAGICAEGQGRFWEFVDALFETERGRTRAQVHSVAEAVGLDVARLDACIDDPATARQLDEDIALAHKFGVRATPTAIVNGLTFQGAMPRPQLVAALDDTEPCECESRPNLGAVCDGGAADEGPISSPRSPASPFPSCE